MTQAEKVPPPREVYELRDLQQLSSRWGNGEVERVSTQRTGEVQEVSAQSPATENAEAVEALKALKVVEAWANKAAVEAQKALDKTEERWSDGQGTKPEGTASLNAQNMKATDLLDALEKKLSAVVSE